jgi:hypothetical protein
LKTFKKREEDTKNKKDEKNSLAGSGLALVLIAEERACV